MFIIDFQSVHQKVTLSAEYKIFGNWRQIISFKDVEYCSAWNNPNSAIAKLFENHVHSLQGLIHKCPYVGPFGIYNFTDQHWVDMDKLDKKGGKLPDLFHGTIFKGDMRLKLKLKTDYDQKVLDFMLAYTLSFRNADTF